MPCTRLASVTRSPSPQRARAARRRIDPTLPEGAVPSETGLLGPLEVRAISEALGKAVSSLGTFWVNIKTPSLTDG